MLPTDVHKGTGQEWTWIYKEIHPQLFDPQGPLKELWTIEGRFFLTDLPRGTLASNWFAQNQCPFFIGWLEVGGANLQIVRPQELLFLSLPKEIQESFHPSGLFF